jgi:hypothetical protein
MDYLFIYFFGFCLFVTGSHYITQAGHKLAILLPQPPKCSTYRLIPPCLASPLMSNFLLLQIEFFSELYLIVHSCSCITSFNAIAHCDIFITGQLSPNNFYLQLLVNSHRWPLQVWHLIIIILWNWTLSYPKLKIIKPDPLFSEQH